MTSLTYIFEGCSVKKAPPNRKRVNIVPNLCWQGNITPSWRGKVCAQYWMTGFFILLIVGRTKPFCCQFVRTGFNISPSWKGQCFYCSLLQRRGFLLIHVAEDRVFIDPCCRGQGFYCSLLQRRGFLLLPVAEDRVFIAPFCRGQGFFIASL